MDNKDNVYDIEYLVHRLYVSLDGDSSNKIDNKTSTLSKPISTVSVPVLAYENKKTFITNYAIICREINREPEEIRKFFETELKVTTSISNNGITVQQKVPPKNIFRILNKYIDHYVKCRSCKCLSTVVTKIGKYNQMTCTKCKSLSFI